MNKIKILLIEDEVDVTRIWERQFGLLLKAEKPSLLIARSISEALKQFELHKKDIKAIVVDGCLRPGGVLNTEMLTQALRRFFVGPMIASSTREDYRQLLLKSGCDHECRKEDVPKIVVELLGLV